MKKVLERLLKEGWKRTRNNIPNLKFPKSCNIRVYRKGNELLMYYHPDDEILGRYRLK